MEVLDFDVTAAFAECSGKEFCKSAGPMATASSLAYCALLLPMSWPRSRIATATGLSRVRKHFAQVRRYALVSGM